MTRDRSGAVAEVIGAVCYALLRSFQIAARGATSAPSVALADRQAAFAADELQRYRIMTERLAELTDQPDEIIEVFRKPIDAFYESASGQGWIETQVFHFVGNTVTNDFAEIISTHVDPETAASMERALTGRTAQEAFALGEITAHVEATGEDGQARVRSYAGAMVGNAINAFREAIEASDALEVVLDGPEGVKALILELLGRHRERLERLGIDELDD